MLAKSKELIGCTINATDGDIGSVTTLYFDDDRWTVRYLVVDTGKWLPGRQVLISPFSIRRDGFTEGTLEVALTREQVKNSPGVDTERPISRQQEIAYSDYYRYPYYWAGPGLWGPGAVPMGPAAPSGGVDATTPGEREALREHDARNSHLRDVKHVSGYHMQAADGAIGHVDDFLIDPDNWTIRYLIVDTSNWIGGRHVLVAPAWVRAIRWETARIELTITRDAIARSPEYDPHRPVQRSYEDRLHAHYLQPPYWTDDRPEDADHASGRTQVARLDELHDLEVADDDTDVRNWVVVAADGLAIGRVDHLIVDRTAMKVRYLEVKLANDGDGVRDVLIPLEYVDLDKPAKRVWLRGMPSTRVPALPSFSGMPVDPQLVAATRTHFAAHVRRTAAEPARRESRKARNRRT